MDDRGGAKMAIDDPIAVLCAQLREHGAPAAEWLARWSATGDPVAAAWAASADGDAMTELLGWIHTEDSEAFGEVRHAYLVAVDSTIGTHATRAAGLRAVREAVVVAPTLAELRAACARRGAGGR